METPTPPTETVPVEQLFTEPAAPPPITPPEQTSTATAVSQPKRRHWGRRILVALLVLIVLGIVAITVTEAGWLHTGVDRIYGKSKVALLWGGMPADANTAIHAALAYASKVEIPDQFTIKETSTVDATIHQTALGTLMNAATGTPATETTTTDTITPTATDGTQFYQMLDTAAAELPTQADQGAPALTNSLPKEDITAKTTFSADGKLSRSKKQFTVNLNLAAESNIPNWKSLNAATTITRDGDTLYIQVPNLSSWPLPESTVAPYRAFYGKYITVPIPSDTQAEIDRYLSQYGTLPDQLTSKDIVSAAQLEKIITSLATRTRRVAIERIDGHAASHWQFVLTKDSLITLIQETTDTLSSGTPADSPLQQSSVQATAAELDQLKQWLPDFTFSLDFWVRRGDYVVVRTTENFSIDSAYVTATATSQNDLTNIPAKQAFSISLPADTDTISAETFNAAVNRSTMTTCGGDKAALSTACLSDPDPTTAYGRDQQRVADLATITSQLSDLIVSGSDYPVSKTVSRLDDPTSPVAIALGNGTPVTFKDPTPEKYYYGYTSDGNTFTLTAVIEDPSLTNCTQHGSLCLYETPSTTATIQPLSTTTPR